MKAPSPSAIIGLRDAQTGDARATRARQLATPSWLSTRPSRSSNGALRPLALLARPLREQRHQPGARYRGRKFSVFLACAPAGAAMTQDDFAAKR